MNVNKDHIGIDEGHLQPLQNHQSRLLLYTGSLRLLETPHSVTDGMTLNLEVLIFIHFRKL